MASMVAISNTAQPALNLHPEARAWLTSPKGELASASLAGLCLLIAWVLSLTNPDGSALELTSQALSWVALCIGLFHGGRAALDAVKAGAFDIDVLMVVGAILASYLGAVSEGALLLFLFTLAGALEALALQRTKRAVEALHKLMPTAALRLDPASGTWLPAPPESLAKGDRVRILPGELVPADATIALGSTSLDQATLTGESMPRDAHPGDEVFAGTLNVGNPIEATVTKLASQSSLQKIIDLVTQAQEQREPVQRVIDRLSQPYAIAVFATSITVFFIWWLAFGDAVKDATYTAITLLIVASPCALIISTPTATLAAISRAARGGVLFKGGQAIERLAQLRALAFDKTGTLTVGKPRVVQVHPVGWSDGQQLLAVAAGLEQHSSHPIATAIVAVAKARSVGPAAVDAVAYTAGRGIGGTIDGDEARLGSLAFTQDLIPVCFHARVRELLGTIQGRGQIAVVCAYRQMAAVFVLIDAVRPGAECLVERLHALGVRPVVMLTGDNSATAARVAESLNLDEFHAQLLPQNKVEHVQALKARITSGRRRGVGVIGDGVNDAPALAAADISIAIGSIGSDAALESADAVLLADDLAVVPWAVALARRTRFTVLANLTFALVAIVAMALAVLVGSRMGYQLPLWLGVIGHEGGTLLVVANSLWLLAFPGVPVCSCDQSHRHETAKVMVEGQPIPAGV